MKLQIATPLKFAALLALLTACDNGAEKRQRDLDSLNTYVKNHQDSLDMYAHQDWTALDNEFETKQAELAKDTAKMKQEAKDAYYKTVNDWQNFKADVKKKSEEGSKLGLMDSLRSSLALDGVRSDFTDVTAPNIVPVYQHFVDIVNRNKDVYTKEQWTVVNVSYKALNGRKREIEKDIKKGDGPKIVKLQLEYTGIKAVNRPLADDPS